MGEEWKKEKRKEEDDDGKEEEVGGGGASGAAPGSLWWEDTWLQRVPPAGALPVLWRRWPHQNKAIALALGQPACAVTAVSTVLLVCACA